MKSLAEIILYDLALVEIYPESDWIFLSLLMYLQTMNV